MTKAAQKIEQSRINYELANKAYLDAKYKFIAWLDHRDAPGGIPALYEKGYWEWQALKLAKSKAYGKYRASIRKLTVF